MDTHKLSQPIILGIGQSCAPPPSGYDSVNLVVATSFGDSTIADNEQTEGSTAYSFYFWLRGLKSGAPWRIGSVSITVSIQIPTKTTTQVFTGTLKSATGTSNEFVSGTLAGSEIWEYDDAATLIKAATPSWSGMTEFEI